MDMNKVKPYLFWIICGAVLVIELVYFSLFLTPAPPTAVKGIRPPQDAQAAQREAVSRLRELDKLTARARTTLRTPPQSELMDPAQADRLTNYIVSKSWENELSREVEKRERGVSAIRTELSARSRSLHVPVSSQTDPVAWYADYQTASAALVQFLVEERVIRPPSSQAADQSLSQLYRSSRELRGIIGLTTADGNQQQFDDAKRREQVMIEFRIIDAVARAVAAVEVAAVANPLAANFEEVGVPVPTKVSIRGITVTAAAKTGTPVSYNVRVELSGTPSVLLAVSQRLDGLVDPIAVRLGSTWSRRQFDVRGKHSVPDVSMDYAADLLILDFFDPALSGN